MQLIRTTFTLLFTFSILYVSAQSPSVSEIITSDTTRSFPVTVASGIIPQAAFKRNILKINIAALALDSYSLSYEYSFAPKMTLAAGYSYVPETSVASVFLVEKAIDLYLQDYGFIVNELNAATIGNSTFTGEARFYTGKHAGARGFYLSLYGRHMNMEATYPYSHATSDYSYLLPLKGKFTGIGGGLMVGAQWLLGERVTFDWYILGGHYGKTKVEMSAMADLSSMTRAEKRELENSFESVNDLLSGQAELEATVTDQGVSLEGSAPFAGIRSLGFSLGVAF